MSDEADGSVEQEVVDDRVASRGTNAHSCRSSAHEFHRKALVTKVYTHGLSCGFGGLNLVTTTWAMRVSEQEIERHIPWSPCSKLLIADITRIMNDEVFIHLKKILVSFQQYWQILDVTIPQLFGYRLYRTIRGIYSKSDARSTSAREAWNAINPAGHVIGMAYESPRYSPQIRVTGNYFLYKAPLLSNVFASFGMRCKV